MAKYTYDFELMKPFIMENKEKYTNAELAKMLNEKFGTHFTTGSLGAYLMRKGVKHEKKRGAFLPKVFPEGYKEWFIANHNESYAYIEEKSEELFGVNMKGRVNFWRYKWKCGSDHKGRFRPGKCSFRTLPSGSEYNTPRGIYIKTENDEWVLKSRYLYEQYHNTKLDKDDLIIFLDNNNKNFDKDNLYRATKQEVGYLLGSKMPLDDVDTRLTLLLHSRLAMKIKKIEKGS